MGKARSLLAALLLVTLTEIFGFFVSRPKSQPHVTLQISPFNSYQASLSRPNNTTSTDDDNSVSSASTPHESYVNGLAAPNTDNSPSLEDSMDHMDSDEELDLRIAQLERYEEMLQKCLETVSRAEKAVTAQNVGARPPISIEGIKEILLSDTDEAW